MELSLKSINEGRLLPDNWKESNIYIYFFSPILYPIQAYVSGCVTTNDNIQNSSCRDIHLLANRNAMSHKPNVLFHVLFPFDRIVFYSYGDFEKDFYFSLFIGIFKTSSNIYDGAFLLK